MLLWFGSLGCFEILDLILIYLLVLLLLGLSEFLLAVFQLCLESLTFVVFLIELIRSHLIDEVERIFEVESFVDVVEHACEEEVQIVAVVRLHVLEEVLDFFFFQREFIEVVDHVYVLQGGHCKCDESK